MVGRKLFSLYIYITEFVLFRFPSFRSVRLQSAAEQFKPFLGRVWARSGYSLGIVGRYMKDLQAPMSFI